MTERPTRDRGVPGLDGDFLTVEQVAELRRVTPAAVRAQLRAGTLVGEQVRQGQRTVWRIPASAVRRYLGTAGGPSPAAERARPRRPSTPPTPARPPAPVPEPQAPPADAEPIRPDTAAAGRVAALEVEVRRLRRQLSAVAEAHRRLLDAVTADLADDAR
ncbi:helix-turn-helix domain-containing protein [Geodermatophilus sp. SYSU D00815]